MGTRQDNIVLNKSMEFAIRIVELYKFLVGNKEYVISKRYKTIAENYVKY